MACGHCYSTRELEQLTSHEFDRKTGGDGSFTYEWYMVVTVERCKDCNQLTLSTYPWSDFSDPDDAEVQIIYPANFDLADLPTNVSRAYTDALKARRIDASYFAIGIRKTLEAVCNEAGIERSRPNSRGGTNMIPLGQRIAKLAETGVLPSSLKATADHLRDLGNLGAHEVTVDEELLSAANQLTEALLDYLYRVPAALSRSLARATQQK